MRPCNQCRQPVENNVTICDECKQWNSSHAQDDSSGSESNLQASSVNNKNAHADYSYAILMGIFSLVITALFALIGFAVGEFYGFFVGALIGIVAGVALFSITIKM